MRGPGWLVTGAERQGRVILSLWPLTAKLQPSEGHTFLESMCVCVFFSSIRILSKVFLFFFLPNSTLIYDKNSLESGYRGNLPEHIKGHI